MALTGAVPLPRRPAAGRRLGSWARAVPPGRCPPPRPATGRGRL